MSTSAANPLLDLGTIKDRLRELLLENTPVRELVMPVQDEESLSARANWLGGTYTVSADTSSPEHQITLIGHCLDVPYLDEAITDERIVLGIEALPIRISSLIDIAITISIYCHRSLIPLSDEERTLYKEQYGFAGNRIDMIMMAVNNAFLDEDISRSFGIGKIHFSAEEPIISVIPNEHFYGKTLTYEVSCHCPSFRRKEQ